MWLSIRDGRAWWRKIESTGFRFVAAVLMSAVLLCGCASTRVDFGGVMSPQAVPASAVQCEDVAWRNVERVPPVFPMDLVRFFYFRQDQSRLTPLLFSFDVDEVGSTANIRFLEPASYTRHATLRKAILSSAEAISQWHFEHDGEATHVTGCTAQMDFTYEMRSTG